jgi:SpoVK/Ycf46/Vps4 family AAA+-type ATPase
MSSSAQLASLDAVIDLCEICDLFATPEDSSGDISDTSPRHLFIQAAEAWNRHVKLMRTEGNHAAAESLTPNDLVRWRRREELLQSLQKSLTIYRRGRLQQEQRAVQGLRQLEVETRQQQSRPQASSMAWLQPWTLWMQVVVRSWQTHMTTEVETCQQWYECAIAGADGDESDYSQEDPPEALPQSSATHTWWESRLIHSTMLDRLTHLVVQLSQTEAEVTTTATQKHLYVRPAEHQIARPSRLVPSSDVETPMTEAKENCIVPSTNPYTFGDVTKAVQAYLEAASAHCTPPQPIQVYLLVGPHGSGKTTLCRKVQQDCSSSCTASREIIVLAPRIPLDFLGRTVGAAEGTWIALLEDIARKCQGQPVVVLLDSLDMVVTDGDSLTSGPQGRLAAGWRLLIDALRVRRLGNVLIVATCTALSEALQARADAVFDLTALSEDTRRHFLHSLTGPIKDVNHEAQHQQEDHPLRSYTQSLEATVHSSVGRSYGELAYQARQMLQQIIDPTEVLEGIQRGLQEEKPPSLTSCATDDLVDLQVWTASDLGTSFSTRTQPGNLLGSDIHQAWRALQSAIVLPLCRSKELQELVGTSERKTMVGGALITGPPGCGKTALAYETARYVTSLDPSVKMISVSCTSLVRKEVGGSEKALYQLFVAVRLAAPCLLLLESIETIAAVRGHDTTTEGTMDRLLSTLLVELDGVDSQAEAPVAVIGTTHNSEWIDPALLRPGRLGAVLCLGLAEEATRRAIVQRGLIELPAIYGDLVDYFVQRTEGLSSATVGSLCNDLCFQSLSIGVPPDQSSVDKVLAGRR